jgi:hypothetical protein
MLEPKPVSPRTATVREIRKSRSLEDLVGTLKGRQILPFEQDEAIRALLRHSAQEMEPNRHVILTFGWDLSKQFPSMAKASAAIFEWLWRIAKKIHGREAHRKATEDLLPFLAIPEFWDRCGEPVPLHYHVPIRVPDHSLAWFDDELTGAAQAWEAISHKFCKVRCRFYVQVVHDSYGLAQYDTKHCNIDAVFRNVLCPSDFAKYRSMHYGVD